MFKKLIGPSPLLFGVNKVHTYLSVRGGIQNQNSDMCLSDEAFFERIAENSDRRLQNKKPPRLKNQQVRDFLSSKKGLTRDQRLVRSVIEEANLSRLITDKDFKNLQEMHNFRRKYKHYLRCKRLLPLGVLCPFTGTELTKMGYAAALGSKSLSFTLGGFLGYSVPAFFFFHMSSYYVPDKLKPICQVGKYALGAPVWVVGTLVDGLLSQPEEMIFGEEVPLDVVGTGGTIPPEIGDVSKLQDVLEDMKQFAKEFNKKTY